MILVSCKDASTLNDVVSFRLDIKKKVCKLEYRKELLNADSARFYVKITKENYPALVEYEGLWVDSVKIIFITV